MALGLRKGPGSCLRRWGGAALAEKCSDDPAVTSEAPQEGTMRVQGILSKGLLGCVECEPRLTEGDSV